MHQFFFNQRSDGVLVKDYIGETLQDLDKAISQAQAIARRLREVRKSGGTVGVQQIEICDETGLTVHVVTVVRIIEAVGDFGKMPGDDAK